MPRPPFPAILAPLLLCSIALAVVPATRVQAPAQRIAVPVDAASLPATAAPCLAGTSAATDRLTAFLWRFEVLRARALSTGQAACLAAVATGPELTSLLGTLNALHIAARPLRITPRGLAVDIVRKEADGSLTVVAQVGEVRTPLTARYRPGGAFFRDDRTVLYRLRPTAGGRGRTGGWLVEDDAIASLPPLPSDLSGPYLADLDGVVNRSTALALAGSATGGNLLRLIAADGFAVHPQSLVPDFFTDPGAAGDGPSSGIYARNAAEAIPSLITLDAALHVYHVLQSRLTVAAEMSVLPRRLQLLLGDLLTVTAAQRARLSGSLAADALQRNAIYLAVADLLAGGAWPADTLTADEAALAAREVNLIRTHLGTARSPVLGHAVDYAAFAPQGHYALSAALTGYAQALRWLGVAAPALGDSRVASLQAVLLALALRERGPDGALMDLWHSLADPLVAFGGPAETPPVPEFERLLTTVYGAGPATASAADPARLARAMALASTSGWRLFSLMPSAVQPDTQLIDGAAPSGLDVLAAFGSAAARRLRPTSSGAGSLTPRAPARLPDDSSLYSGGLAALRALAAPVAAGAPPFMRGTAWSRAGLASALGWWSEMHQDPQPLVGLLDRRIVPTDLSEAAPARPIYVESEPAAWYALAQLAARLAGLTVDAHLLDGLPAADATAFQAAERAYAETVLRLAHIADDELSGSPVGPADAPALRDPDRTLGACALIAEHHAPGPLHLAGSQSAALADIAGALEAGEGPPQELWALVPIGGALYLARGVVYSYYEFAMPPHPISDAAWQSGAWMQRRQPGWTAAYER